MHVPAEGQAHHACAVIFLVPGLYKLYAHSLHACTAATNGHAFPGAVGLAAPEVLSVSVSPLYVLVG